MNAPVLTYRREAEKPHAFDALTAVRIVRAVLTDDRVEVPGGTSGTVVGIWAGGAAYEVEFEAGLATVAAADLTLA